MGDTGLTLGGNAGWAGAGLLGLVLVWLLFRHLPEKDRQLAVFIQGKDAHVELLCASHARQVDALIAHHEKVTVAQRDDFRASLDRMAAQCERELAGVALAFGKHLEGLGVGVNELNTYIRLMFKDAGGYYGHEKLKRERDGD